MRANPYISQSQTLRLDTTKSIVGYTHYLLMRGQMAGNLVFDGHKPTNEEKSIAKRLQELSRQLSLRLYVCREKEIADLLECYDMAFRIGYQRLPDAEMVSRQKDRLVKAWREKKGNVEDSSVFGMIAGDVKYKPGYRNEDFISAYKTILQSWLTTLLENNTFPGISSYEKYQRLSMIMRENLDQYIDDAQQLKRQWYEFNKIDNIPTLSSSILRSYRRFISSLPPVIINFEEKLDLDNQILRELSSRKDLDPYDTEAFRLALQLSMEMIQEEIE